MKAFAAARGSYSAAARLLGLHPNYLHRLIRNLNLKPLLKKSGGERQHQAGAMTPIASRSGRSAGGRNRDIRLISRLNSIADVATLAAERLLPLTARGRLARGRAVTVPQGQ